MEKRFQNNANSSWKKAPLDRDSIERVTKPSFMQCQRATQIQFLHSLNITLNDRFYPLYPSRIFIPAQEHIVLSHRSPSLSG